MTRRRFPARRARLPARPVASYELPRRVLFFAEEELTLTGNAEIRADELRKLAVERLAGSENAF